MIVRLVLGVLACVALSLVLVGIGLTMVFDGRRRITVVLGTVVLFATVPAMALVAWLVAG